MGACVDRPVGPHPRHIVRGSCLMRTSVHRVIPMRHSKMNPRNASFAADQMEGVPVAISAVFGSGAS